MAKCDRCGNASVGQEEEHGEFNRSLVRLKTILVPVDFSRESLRVLEFSIPFARHFGAAIHVLHVRPSSESAAIERAGNLLVNYTEVLDFLHDRVTDIERKYQATFLANNCHVFAGAPARTICRVARDLNADLIALATHGESGLKRIVLGSTAQRVVRHAGCPVLIPRGKNYNTTVRRLGPESGIAFRTILAPVDFSPECIAGVRYAGFLAAAFKANLRLLHVVHAQTAPGTPEAIAANPPPFIGAALAAARKEMERLRRRHVLSTLACETDVRLGYPLDGICLESALPGVDLVVLSTHGRSGLREMVIGSVAEHVVRYAECPVITVPSALDATLTHGSSK